MALTNAERQRKWMEKHRALHNMRRRNKRKDLSGGVESRHATTDVSSPSTVNGQPKGDSGGSVPPAQTLKVEELRQLMKAASAEPTLPAVKPVIFRDDHGRVISERQWNVLQRLKAKAKAGGYELDDFIQ